jgi:RNA recognition motif-containing protein
VKVFPAKHHLLIVSLLYACVSLSIFINQLLFEMNIYVSNLSFNVQDEDLKGFFEEYGEVSSAKVITDKFTGRSRGFGFVEMSDDAAAQKAIQELDGATVEGRAIKVSEAKPREARPSNGGSGGGAPRRNFGGGGGGGNRW